MSFLRPGILGGVDGIITSFTIVVSCHAAGFDQSTVLVIGISSLIADGFSMGISEYLSSRSSNVRLNFNKRQLEEGLDSSEKNKLISELEQNIINNEGLKKTQARRIAILLSNHPSLFARVYGIDTDNIQPAWLLGLTCLASFIACGSVPLLSYIPFQSISMCIFISLCLLLILGLFREPDKKINSFIETGLLGVVAGVIAYSSAMLVVFINE